MNCSVKGCPFNATHKQLNLPDSIGLGKTPGSFNYYCSQHAPIFIDLYNQSKKLREEHANEVPGRVAEPFGPVYKIV